MRQTILLESTLVESTVQCIDGSGGSVHGVILDPESTRLEYLVVHRGLFRGHDYAVPARAIQDAIPLTVTLTLSVAELQELPEVEYLSPGVGIIHYTIPEHCAVLRTATPITDTAGNTLGHVHGIVIDRVGQVKSILHSGAGETEIPIARLVRCSAEGLTVQLAEDAEIEQRAATERDPVCLRDVDPAMSEQTTYHGRTYYFCSPECKRRFVLDPEQYVGQQRTAGA